MRKIYSGAFGVIAAALVLFSPSHSALEGEPAWPFASASTCRRDAIKQILLDQRREQKNYMDDVRAANDSMRAKFKRYKEALASTDKWGDESERRDMRAAMDSLELKYAQSSERLAGLSPEKEGAIPTIEISESEKNDGTIVFLISLGTPYPIMMERNFEQSEIMKANKMAITVNPAKRGDSVADAYSAEASFYPDEAYRPALIRSSGLVEYIKQPGPIDYDLPLSKREFGGYQESTLNKRGQIGLWQKFFDCSGLTLQL
jgi:hypothetical protein